MNQEEKNEVKNKIQEEKVLQAKTGFGMLILSLLLLAAGVAGFGFGILSDGSGRKISRSNTFDCRLYHNRDCRCLMLWS